LFRERKRVADLISSKAADFDLHSLVAILVLPHHPHQPQQCADGKLGNATVLSLLALLVQKCKY
jgi:hypothetical protein